MIAITPRLSLDESEVTFSYTCSPGPGGQNVNKVATAVLLRFNIKTATSLPEEVRLRLLSLLGNRLTQQGDLIIKASCYRTQMRNKQDALARLKEILVRATVVPKKRKKTKPTLGAVERRLTKKKQHAKTKLLRQSHRDQEF